MPKDPESIRLIAVSCKAYEGGYFSAFEAIAKKDDKIDAVIHFGDYIYEGYKPQYFEKKDRIPLPKDGNKSFRNSTLS